MYEGSVALMVCMPIGIRCQVYTCSKYLASTPTCIIQSVCEMNEQFFVMLDLGFGLG